MKKYIPKKTILITASVVSIFVSSFISYVILNWAAERFFFDKLIYKKSAKYGYCKTGCDPENQPERYKDLANLLGKKVNPGLSILGKSSSNTYTIAVIGDSFVWGKGIKTKDNLTVKLKNKLSNIRHTEVLQVGMGGDSALNNLTKARLIEQEKNIDLFIFVITENDLLYNKSWYYDNDFENKIIESCTTPSQSPTYNKFPIGSYLEDPNYNYNELIIESYQNPINLCILDKTSTLYPKNSIFLDGEWTNNFKHTHMQIYKAVLEKHNLVTLDISETRYDPIYTKYWENPKENFQVSKKELHPSKILHTIYADVLFKEITQNKRWNYI